jgi:hypothetical protein
MDLVSVVFAGLIILGFEIDSSETEIRVYNERLKGISALISRVDSYRIRLSAMLTSEDEKWFIEEIQRAKSALRDAERLVDWTKEARGGTRGAWRRIQWVLQDRRTADRHEELLRHYHDSLLSIESQLVTKDAQLPRPPKNYFQDIQRRTIEHFAERVERNAVMNSGKGVRLSRTRLSDLK